MEPYANGLCQIPRPNPSVVHLIHPDFNVPKPWCMPAHSGVAVRETDATETDCVRCLEKRDGLRPRG